MLWPVDERRRVAPRGQRGSRERRRIGSRARERTVSKAEMTTTAFVVIEPGGDWPGQVGESMDVVAFPNGADDLLPRTREKLGAIHRSEQGVRVAVLACNSTAGGATALRRVQLARLLFGAVTSATRGRVGEVSRDRRPSRAEGPLGCHKTNGV
jgi:hypothetical protein